MTSTRRFSLWPWCGAVLLASACGRALPPGAGLEVCGSTVDSPPDGAPGRCPAFRAHYANCHFVRTPIPLAPPEVFIEPEAEGFAVTVIAGKERVLNRFTPDGARRDSVEAELEGDFPATKRVWCGDEGLIAKYVVDPDGPKPVYKEIRLRTPEEGQLELLVEQGCKTVFEVHCAG